MKLMAKANRRICACEMNDNYDVMARRDSIPNDERCPSCVVLPDDYDPDSFTQIEKAYSAARNAWWEVKHSLEDAADTLASEEMLLTHARRMADALTHQSVCSDEYKKIHNELSCALRRVAVARRRLDRVVKAAIPIEDEYATVSQNYWVAKLLDMGYSRQREKMS